MSDFDVLDQICDSTVTVTFSLPDGLGVSSLLRTVQQKCKVVHKMLHFLDLS